MSVDDCVEGFVDDGNFSLAVIETVAEAIGIEPHKLQARLYDRVDPDGLDAVFSSRQSRGRRLGGKLEFEFVECDVVVYSEGRVVVYPPERRAAVAAQRPKTGAGVHS